MHTYCIYIRSYIKYNTKIYLASQLHGYLLQLGHLMLSTLYYVDIYVSHHAAHHLPCTSIIKCTHGY